MTDVMPRFVGVPDGPLINRPELGREVGTFTLAPTTGKKCLMWHVPLNMRGHFRPDQLANYDPDKEYRTDAYGFAMCLAKSASTDKPCRRKAVNRYPRCDVHGGTLHPMDLLIKETGEPETEEPMSRYQQFLAKQITVDDLDDDELMGFGFRNARGQIFKPKNIPREMVDAFTKAIFERSLHKLKNSALDAAKTLTGLMLDETVDANIRRQCAESILDRTIGKAPLNVSITPGAAWETVFESISHSPSEPIDAEVVPDAEMPAIAGKVTIRPPSAEQGD